MLCRICRATRRRNFPRTPTSNMWYSLYCCGGIPVAAHILTRIRFTWGLPRSYVPLSVRFSVSQQMCTGQPSLDRGPMYVRLPSPPVARLTPCLPRPTLGRSPGVYNVGKGGGIFISPPPPQ